MKHFSTFSQRPSPQAPAPRPQKMLQITLVSWDKFSSRLDQMAPHSCPFLVSNFEVFQKPRSRPPLPSKNHHGKNGKHHFTPVFVLNQLDPILPMVMSKKAKEMGNGGLWTTSKFEISNGHEWGAIWSNRDENLSHDTAIASFCSGEGFQGAWGLGRWEKVEKCFIFGPLFFELFQIFKKKMKKMNEIGQIRSDWADIDSGRIPASSFRLLGGFWPIFPKK